MCQGFSGAQSCTRNCQPCEEVRQFEQHSGKVLAKIGGICGDTREGLCRMQLPIRRTPRDIGLTTEVCLASPLFPMLPMKNSSSTAAPLERRFPSSASTCSRRLAGVRSTQSSGKALSKLNLLLPSRSPRSTGIRPWKCCVLSPTADAALKSLFTPAMTTTSSPIFSPSFASENGPRTLWAACWDSGRCGRAGPSNCFRSVHDAKLNRARLDTVLTRGAEITDANAAIFDARNQFKGCIPGIHEVLRRQGLLTGRWCLEPSEVLSKGERLEEIDRVYSSYPLLNDDQFVAENLDRWLK